MPRIARVILPGVPHHITQRGTRRFNVFLDDADRKTYLQFLKESCQRYQMQVAAYCLMTNHVHFVAVPQHPDSIWRVFHRCHGAYATRYNLKYGWTGHLWQARPFSCPLDDAHLWAAIRYVECNPVRARLVDRAEDYLWSSAAAHCGLRDDPLIDVEWLSPESVQDWKQWLAVGNEAEVEKRIREQTFTGRPCGNEAFVRNAEEQLARSFGPQKSGPKPKRLGVGR